MDTSRVVGWAVRSAVSMADTMDACSAARWAGPMDVMSVDGMADTMDELRVGSWVGQKDLSVVTMDGL